MKARDTFESRSCKSDGGRLCGLSLQGPLNQQQQQQPPPPIICQPNAETMIGKQRCPDIHRDPRLASRLHAPSRPMSAHKNKPVFHEMLLR